MCPAIASAEPTVARQWTESLREAIRLDFTSRPTVQARNFFHLSVAMYDAWVAYDNGSSPYMLGREIAGVAVPFAGVAKPADLRAARNEAISYAAYRLLHHRFRNIIISSEEAQAVFDAQLAALGYDSSITSTDYRSGSPAALGNYIAQGLIEIGLQDGSNEALRHANQIYQPTNPPLFPALRGNGTIVDLNRWQPLVVKEFIDQTNVIYDGELPDFISPEWGFVTPFALRRDDLTIHERDGVKYLVYHDPGPPIYASGDGADPRDNGPVEGEGSLNSDFLWGHLLVVLWSAHLDPADGVTIDISPAVIGNLDLDELPRTPSEMRDFYDVSEGGDGSPGHDLNPVTEEPYESQIVPRGDYARVVAEYWAGGLETETTPGTWFTILDQVSDHPQFEKRYRGEGEELDRLEWEVKAYFTLGGALHDAAISAWSIKGWYDYVRPLSVFRWLSDHGQSSATDHESYSPFGLPLVPGHIEIIEQGDPVAEVAGDPDFNVGRVKLLAWRGPEFVFDKEIDVAGVHWILARHWWPYQRATYVTPNSAGYVSGHATFGRAAAEVLTQLTGDPFFPGGMGKFHAQRNEFLKLEDGPSVDVTLQWATYRDAADQAAIAQIWGGTQPPVADISGRRIGARVGIDAFALADQFIKGRPPTVVEERSRDVVPEAFALLANHPNPFNGRTTIRFDLAEPDDVQLAVFNLAGQRVAVLASGARTEGAYEFLWDGRGDDGHQLATGVYVAQLKAGARAERRKLLLLR